MPIYAAKGNLDFLLLEIEADNRKEAYHRGKERLEEMLKHLESLKEKGYFRECTIKLAVADQGQHRMPEEEY
jgi:hypothetical protein